MKKLITSLLFICFSSPTIAQDLPRAEDVATIDGIIKAYYEVVSGAKGEKSQKARDFSLHRPDAKVTTLGKDKDGNITIRETKLEGYYEGKGPIIENNFFEYEIARKIDRIGNVAHVWSTYEFKLGEKDGPVSGKGINSIQLFHDGDRWWITAEMWDNSVEEESIPARYLPPKSVFNFINFKTPTSNLMTGGMPNDDDLQALADRGIKTIINFRPSSEHPDFDEAAKVKALGMTYVNIPIDGLKEATAENAALLKAALDANGDDKVFLHCRSGTRVGVMLGLEKFLHEGYSLDAAANFATSANTESTGKRTKDILEKLNK
jgi:uncharacterized protein (TIGR01244 family)